MYNEHCCRQGPSAAAGQFERLFCRQNEDCCLHMQAFLLQDGVKGSEVLLKDCAHHMQAFLLLDSVKGFGVLHKDCWRHVRAFVLLDDFKDSCVELRLLASRAGLLVAG